MVLSTDPAAECTVIWWRVAATAAICGWWLAVCHQASHAASSTARYQPPGNDTRLGTGVVVASARIGIG